MNRPLYSLLFYLALPFIVLRLLWRALRAPAYARRWGERFGIGLSHSRARARPELSGWIWIHAVSVGESIAAAPLVRRLRERRPEYGIIITTMTPTGSERVREMFAEFAGDVVHVYAPYDYPGAVRRFLHTFRPAMVVLMETELWPNIVHYSRQSGAQVVVANARLSEKSFRGYQRFSRLGAPMLRQIDCIGAQAANDAQRFEKLGVPGDRLQITGSIKFELELPANLPEKVGELAALVDDDRPVWIAASTRTHGGVDEEEFVIEAFRRCLQQIPELLLILVPRHPERFARVARLCEEASLPVVRRSSGEKTDPLTKVLLGDSMGEMLAYYSISDVAFVGGTLVETGSQNVLEPAALGLPVVAGPSRFNFQTVSEQLEEAGALRQVRDAHMLAEAVINILQDPALKAKMGSAGRRVIAENRGALDRTFELINARLPT